MTSTAPVDSANQRNAVLAGFLGWTLDAFDFFILTLVIEDLAHAFFPGSPLEEARPRIALAITLTLAMRPIGAVVFGLLADRYGRRLPLMLNVLFYAAISVLCGLAQTYWQFIGLRMLFGVGMGGEWGVGASLALESASPKIRGLLSGLLQEGLCDRQPAGRARLPHRLSVGRGALPRQCLARDVLPRRPAGAAVALHPHARQGIRGVARAPHRLAHLSRRRPAATRAASSTWSC